MHYALDKGPDYIPNIVSFYHNGYWEKNILGNIRANFYFNETPNIPISTTFTLPDNVIPINLGDVNVRYDAILCTDKMLNFNGAASLSHQLHCPFIVYEHSYRPSHIGLVQKTQLKQNLGNFNAFASQEIAESWGFSPEECRIIEPNISFKADIPKQNTVVIFAQNIRTNDENNVLNRLISHIPNAKVIDNNKTEYEIHEIIAGSRIFVDIVNNYEIPWEISLALDYNNYVISNHSPVLSSIINDKNGKIIKDFNEVPGIIRQMPQNTELDRKKNADAILELAQILQDCVNTGYRR